MSNSRKSGHSKSFEKYHDKGSYNIGDQGREMLKSIDENSQVIKSFRQYAVKLDAYHDRFERIVKISRDIVVESKRIIFLLHTSDGINIKEKALEEAEKRLNTLVKVNFFKIACELKGEDPYMYHKAFTFSLQEFIEAYTFFHYLRDNKLYHWDHYQNLFIYKDTQVSSLADMPSCETEEKGYSSSEVVATLPPSDFILGLADLSGELMRRCNNNVGLGNLRGSFETCNIVRKLYAGFLSLGFCIGKEISSKVHTLRRSLLKMEKVCYNIYVRSKEPGDSRLALLFTEFEYKDKDDDF